MDFNKAKEYISKMKNNISEEEIVKEYNITYEELYAVIAFEDQGFAYDYLKHFCRGCFNDICFCWPMVDEASCPVRGYEPNCPLKSE